jgi:hypothetical protein
MGNFRNIAATLVMGLLLSACSSQQVLYESPTAISQPISPVLTNTPLEESVPYDKDEPIREEVLTTKAVPNYIAQEAVSPGYGGNCACPNDLDSAGHRCGARSAYSRAGGYNAVCTPTQSFAYLPKAPVYGGTTYVRGYYRKNGTYVNSYSRKKR